MDDELVDRTLHPPPPWLEQLAELVAEKLKPAIGAEVRAALKAEPRRRARERAA